MKTKELVRTSNIVTFLLFLIGTFASSLSQARPAPPQYPSHLPYTFSNLVWWSDEELRALLKKKIPGLGDKIATTSAAESRVRDALKALLLEKGIQAEVQSEEPSNSSFRPPTVNMLGMDDPEETPYSPAIIFSVLTPHVVYGRTSVNSDAGDLTSTIDKEVEDTKGKEFTSGSMDFSGTRIRKIAKEHGYLASKVTVQQSSPHKVGSDWAVDVTVSVNAGPQFHISAIAVDGGPLFAGKDLTQFIKIRQGQVAGISPFWQLGSQLRAYYQQFGYADVQIRDEPKIDNEHAMVAYSLKVIPGPEYHLRSLMIEKLGKEQEARVREIFGMKPGDVYHEDAIMGLYRKISDEPALKGYSFSFSPKPDKVAATVDLSLSFFREGGEATVTTQ